MRRALLLFAVACLAGCSLSYSGERGGYESYAIRFKVSDADSGRGLSGVSVQVKDGRTSVAGAGRTDAFGDYTFRKEYGRQKARAIRSRAGYPNYFIVTFAKDGYKRLIVTLAERNYRFGFSRSMSVSRKEVELERGTGDVKVDERGAD